MWVNQDGLPLQYGTQKAVPEAWSDYLAYGQTRVAEGLIDLKSLGSSAQLQSLNEILPAGYNVLIERVQLVVEEASAGGTSFSVGFGYPTSASTYSNITVRSEASTSSSVTTTSNTVSTPSVTSISDTALVNALANASTNTLGTVIDMTVGSTSVGGYVGTAGADTTTTNPSFVTAKASGTYTAGLIRCRVFYRGYGTIIN
jgi:hypothetical protein